MVIISSQPFSMASFSVNDSQLPAGIVISSGGTCRYGAKILGSNETQSREISCHHGLATFRSEISPLRNAFVEMTGGGISVSLIVWNLQISSFENGGRSREALAFFGSILYNETIKLM